MGMIEDLQQEHAQMIQEDIYDVELQPIFKTNDYQKFKVIAGNRKIKANHLERLLKAMRKKYLVIPIMVNEKYEIIDGQHRFINAMRLGLPVFYFFNEAYELSEVQKLNTNMTNWTSADYLMGYVDLGLQDYVKFKEFYDTYKFGYGELRVMLTGDPSYQTMVDFKEGTFKITQEDIFMEQARMLMEIKPFYAGYQMRNFIKAMLILFRNENFDFERFLKKLSFTSELMVDCTNVKQYLAVIEDIYNFKVAQRNAVSLKYSK